MDHITLDLEGVVAIRVVLCRRGITARVGDDDGGTLTGDVLEAVKVNRSNDSLEIREPRCDDDDAGDDMGPLELSLPSGRFWDLAVDSVNGRVLVTGVEGSVRVRTVNGAVVLQDLTGTAEVRCANGSITAERISGQLNVSAANGKVTVFDADLTGGKFRNDSGRMALQFSPADHGKVSIMSGAGDVLLALPTDADVTATVASRGRLISRLGAPVITAGSGFARVAMGSGSFSIFVRTMGRCELVEYDDFESKERRSGDTAFPDDDYDWDDRDFSFEMPGEIWEFLKEMHGYGLKFGRLGEEISRQLYEAFGPGFRRRRGPRRGPARARWTSEHWHERPCHTEHRRQKTAESDAQGNEEEVRVVLEMLREGKISAEEATRLISALRR